MKKKQGLLVMLLGCLVTVTAIAGVLVWQGNRSDYTEPESPSEQLSWNDDMTATEDETTEEETTKEETTAEEITETQQRETEQETEALADAEETPSEAPAAAEQVRSVNFDEADRLSWPVEGTVLMEFSMDRTVYFPTLDQYKCSPAVLIQGEAGTQVKAPADALVKVVGSNEELGNYMTLDLGNGYELTCGQLDQTELSPGDFVEAGGVIGTIAEPTKYYVVEGPNLYFQMTKDGTPVDPLDYME